MPYFSGYRRDKSTGKWLSPYEQSLRRERRERIAHLAATHSADELIAQGVIQRALVYDIHSRFKLAEKRVEMDKATIHAAVDDIRRIAHRHQWLKICVLDSTGKVSDFHYFGSLLPAKTDKEPYARLPKDSLDMICIRASVNRALNRLTLFSKIFGWGKRLEDLLRALPALERAIANLDYMSPSNIKAEGIVENAKRHELAEALEQRQRADADTERKRHSEERRRYEKARLAAIDEKTRQAVAAYRDLVEFTGSCAYCEAVIGRGGNAHLDHIMPVAKGGLNSIDNLVGPVTVATC